MPTVPPLAAALLPQLTAAIYNDLAARPDPDLARQVPRLRIVSRCTCTDTFCGSFRTASRQDGPTSRPRTLNIDVDHGMVNLDVTDGRIVFVEVIDRPDDRRRLHAAAL